MNLSFDYARHKYYLDGKPIPGVSEILEGAGLSDPRWYKDGSAQKGTDIHSVIEQYNKGELESAGEYSGYLQAWREFLSDREITVESAEERMYHPLYRYAGTIDCTGSCGSSRVLVDVKTGVEQRWHKLQVAAYGLLCDQPELVIVYLKEDGYRAVDSDYRDKEVFLSALRCWKWSNYDH